MRARITERYGGAGDQRVLRKININFDAEEREEPVPHPMLETLAACWQAGSGACGAPRRRWRRTHAPSLAPRRRDAHTTIFRKGPRRPGRRGEGSAGGRHGRGATHGRRRPIGRTSVWVRSHDTWRGWRRGSPSRGTPGAEAPQGETCIGPRSRPGTRPAAEMSANAASWVMSTLRQPVTPDMEGKP